MINSTVIYGPPGCGKTTAIIDRMAEAVSRGTPSSRIGLVSFTRAAAHEIAKRAGVSPGKNVSTLHSYAFRLNGMIRDQVIDKPKLREFSMVSKIQTTGASVYDEEQLGEGDFYLSAYGYMRSTMVGEVEAYKACGSEGNLRSFRYFIKAYDQWKQAHGYMDFSDMLDSALDQSPPDLDLLFLDEAQDFSPAQWRLIESWVPHINEMVLALDDDQCQPPGTMVETPAGEVAIESLRDGDRVTAWTSGKPTSRAVKVAARDYAGKLVKVQAGGKESRYTSGHTCLVRYKEDLSNTRCLYLMRRGNLFRVGQTRAMKQSGGAKYVRMYAKNLNSDLHEVATLEDGELKWQEFTVSEEEYTGEVHSLEVDKSRNYFGGGIFTHNCLYKFTGADPEGGPRFERRYNSKRVVLDQSYRVPANIHALAERTIQRVKTRVSKEYLPVAPGGNINRYGSIHTLPVPEAPTDTLILFRNHSLRGEIETWLIDRGVPYLTDNGRRGPLQGALAAAIRAWTVAQQNHEHTGMTMLDSRSQSLLRRMVKPIYSTKFQQEDLDKIIHKSWSQVLKAPLPMLAYFDRLNRHYGTPLPSTQVHLSTIHGAKGREAHRVILLDAMSNRTAEAYTHDPDPEIRAFYVGITRTKQRLDVVAGENPMGVLR
jgi:hypothetical protein